MLNEPSKDLRAERGKMIVVDKEEMNKKGRNLKISRVNLTWDENIDI